MNRHPWKNLLEQPGQGDHIAQIYQDQEFLTEAVNLFIGAGLRANENVLVIATESHWESFAKRLKKEGFNPADALQRGQLHFVDAEKVSSRFIVNGTPDVDGIRGFINDIRNHLDTRNTTIRIYGEIVDILWLQGSLDGAMQLEQLWNELRQERFFLLFCSYQMNNLSREAYGGPLRSVCETHTHLIPARDYARFDQAVERVLLNLVGRSMYSQIRELAGERISAAMPDGQATILFLQENMPHTADQVLSQVRSQLQ